MMHLSQNPLLDSTFRESLQVQSVQTIVKQESRYVQATPEVYFASPYLNTRKGGVCRVVNTLQAGT